MYCFKFFSFRFHIANILENWDFNASLFEGYFLFIGCRYGILFYHEVRFENDFGNEDIVKTECQF